MKKKRENLQIKRERGERERKRQTDKQTDRDIETERREVMCEHYYLTQTIT